MKEPRGSSTQEVRPRTLTLIPNWCGPSLIPMAHHDPSNVLTNNKNSMKTHNPQEPRKTFRISTNTKTSPQKNKQKERPCHYNPNPLDRATSSEQKQKKDKQTL